MRKLCVFWDGIYLSRLVVTVVVYKEVRMS
jgi:hypothetical protein